jgi:hypothetical protein
LGERRRPWFTWAPPFVVVLAILCIRNRFLFTRRLYEQGDAGANSILITQAKHFTLLVGNYSREGFNHPGPAYLYVQAAGEWLLRDTLPLVPTAWNAHILAVFALNCAFVSLGTMVVYGWTPRGALAGFAVLAGLAIWQPSVLNSDWMPYMYVLPYVVLVIAAASVAAGAVRDVWIVTLSGWLLIHGHACFLVIVPGIVAATVLFLLWQNGWRAVLLGLRRHAIPVAVISAVFLLPIAAELALHWPGNFGKYFSYGKSSHAGGHGPAQILHYMLWFWWPHPFGWLAALAVFAVAVVAAWLARDRFLLALLGLNLVSTAAVTLYAAAGIDDLSQYYIAYFYWSAPAVTVLVIVLAVLRGLPAGAGLAVAGIAALAVTAVIAFLPGTRTDSTNDIDNSLPGAVAALAARAPGAVLVLDIQHNAWVETAGFLVQAERTGVKACVAQSWYQFLFTSQFICTPAQERGGVRYTFDTQAPPAGTLLHFSGVWVTAG